MIFEVDDEMLCSCDCDCEEYFCEHQCYTECNLCHMQNIPVIDGSAPDLCNNYEKIVELA